MSQDLLLLSPVGSNMYITTNREVEIFSISSGVWYRQGIHEDLCNIYHIAICHLFPKSLQSTILSFIHLHENSAVQVVNKGREMSTAQTSVKWGGRQNSKMTPNDPHPCISPSPECIWNLWLASNPQNMARVIGYHFHDYVMLYDKDEGTFADIIELTDQLT